MGLLDLDMSTPEGQGFNSALMAAAQALLTPRSQGGGMGAAFGAFPQAIDRAKQNAMREQLMALQRQQVGLQTDKLGFDMDEARRRLAQQQAAQARFAQLVGQLPEGERATAELVGPGYFEPKTLSPGGMLVSGGKTVAQAPFKPDAPPELARLLQVRDSLPEGHQWRPIYDRQIEKMTTHAPGTNVSVKVDNKMGESLGAQVGPILKDSATATGGAVKMAGSAQRIIAALDSGNVIAGPGASWVLRGAQLADVLGVGGKSNAEKISNTRQVVRGLAEASLEARKELQGQGQVTENEAAAVQKAMSGNIDELTPSEIRLIAGLNIKAAKLRVRQHQQKLQAVPQEMGNVAPFYAVPGADAVLQIPDATEPAAPAASSASKRLRFNAQTGRLE